MAEKFSELCAQMSPESRARVEVKAQAMLAEVLHFEQPSITRMEKRTDIYLSTLHSHMMAMDGCLRWSRVFRMV